MAEATKKYAVVTGANKGIGLEICRQLACKGIVVVLTARDEKRGLEAAQKLKDSGLSDYVVFHQLDVADDASVTSLADFIKTQFGKLDILVNNAGVSGVKIDADVMRAMGVGKMQEGVPINFNAIPTPTYELAEEGLNINYYGAKRMAEALIPLLQVSDSPRIVHVSSSRGQLKHVSNEWAKGILADVENLTEKKVDEILRQYLKDFKECSLEAKGWPSRGSYSLSKAAMNAYTRILAKKYPTFCINCVCPGFVKTDMSCNMGHLSVEEGAESPVTLALLPIGGPSGRFFQRKEESNF